MRILVLIVVFPILAVGLLAWSQSRTPAYTVSGFIEADEIRVGSRIGGRVQEVFAKEGQSLKRGAALVKIEPFDLNERLAQTQATFAAAKANLEKLQAGFRTEEVEQARAKRNRYQAVVDRLKAGARPLELKILVDKLEAAQAELANADSEYKRVKLLREGSENLTAGREWDVAVNLLSLARARVVAAEDELALAKEGARIEEVAEAQASLAEAAQALAMLEKGSRTEDVAQAAAQVAAADAAVGMIRRQMDELTINAPTDSVVEAVDLQPGDLIAPNAPVISLLDPASLYVRAYAPENRLNLAIGQKVTLTVDSFPERKFAGHITFISRQAEFTPSNVQTQEKRSKQVFRIKIKIDEGLDILRAGMAADVLLEPAQ